jgi:hypothetical protein
MPRLVNYPPDTAAILVLQFCYNSYTVARQNLLCKNKKNRYAVFFHAVFRHFLPACLSLMSKNRLVYQAVPGNFARKRPNPNGYAKRGGRVAAKKWRRGPPGGGPPFFRLTGPVRIF